MSATAVPSTSPPPAASPRLAAPPASRPGSAAGASTSNPPAPRGVPASSPTGAWPRRLLKSVRDLVLPIAAISVVFVMLVPMPAALLDVLLALSMAAAVLVFLSAVQVRRAVDFSVFPTLLLLLTLFRLSLNIASSRGFCYTGAKARPPRAASSRPSASSSWAEITWSASCSSWP